MKAFSAFLKKEFLEGARTYKTFIIIAVFVIFGIISPITAKLIPLIFEMVQMEGFITIPDPTALDSYGQFFKNVGQLGLIVFVIVYMGMLNAEISKGTLIIGITRGLARKSVIIAKYLSAVTVWTASLSLSAFITFLYTEYLFSHDVVSNLLMSFFCMWLFGALLLAVLMFASVISSGNFAPLLITGAFSVTLTILELFPKLQRYNPIRLSVDNIIMLTNGYDLSTLTVPLILSAVMIVGLVSASIMLFDKKQL